MQDFYSIEAEIRIRNWLAKGTVEFGDEEDAAWFDNILNQAVS